MEYLIKMLKLIIVSFSLVFFLFGCNSDLSEEEKKALWEKAQTKGEIIRRSGTPYNLATHEDLAMSDAENRLRTGGGLLGNKASLSWGGKKENNTQTTSTIGMPINPYLWRASIETIDFMPLSSIDPFAGTIITDWFTSEANVNERCKLNIFINGVELKTDNLRVSSFCQSLKSNQWVNMESNPDDNIKLENAILNKAKKLKLKAS